MGCSLRSVHEASDFPHFPTSFARKGRSRLLARIDGLHDRAIGRRMGPAKSQQRKQGLVRAVIDRKGTGSVLDRERESSINQLLTAETEILRCP
jgi:hypothetical protein